MDGRWRRMEAVMVGATSARVLIAALLVGVSAHMSLVALTLLATLVAADVFDGVIARRLGVDTVRRRIADVAADKLIIHSVFAGTIMTHPEYILFYAPLLARDLLATVGYAVLLIKERYLVVGRGWHKLSSLSAGLLFASMVGGSTEVILSCALLSWVANYLLLADFAGVMRVVRARPSLPAGAALERIETSGTRGLKAWLPAVESPRAALGAGLRAGLRSIVAGLGKRSLRPLQ